jgi:hypothetical protein
MAAADKMADFFDVAWQIDFYCQEVYLCQRDVCKICSFVTIHLFTSIHTYIYGILGSGYSTGNRTRRDRLFGYGISI